jgi:hypothetical protein
MGDTKQLCTERLKKDELRQILIELLERHELDVPQKVDGTNIATLNTVGLRGAIAECCGFEYYDHHPFDHWASRTGSIHREGQEAFTNEELKHVRDELNGLVDTDTGT